MDNTLRDYNFEYYAKSYANLLRRISPDNIATAPAQTLAILRLTSGF